MATDPRNAGRAHGTVAVICPDTSVVAQWLLPETHSAKVEALIAETLAAGELIVAPPLLPLETANVLRKHVVQKNLSHADAERLLARFDTLPITIRTPRDSHRRALNLAETYGLPAVYDACFIALSQRLGCDFWTDDMVLLRTLNKRLPFVRWIGSYTPSVPPEV
jgi:predicted nucleic acid-binding protein